MIEIQLTKGYKAIVDDIDADLAKLKWHSWWGSNKKKIYAAHGIITPSGPRKIFLHRVVLERKLGRTLTTREQTDHQDRNSLNDTRDNLRVASIGENSENKELTTNNSSGYKGVSWNREHYAYKAQIRHRRKLVFLGYFKDARDAARAYDEAAVRLHGEFAVTNHDMGLI